MTWNEYLEYLMERGCSFENAQNVIGNQMDIYEDWDWKHKIPLRLKIMNRVVEYVFIGIAIAYVIILMSI